MKRIRPLALLAGLGTDITGTIIFSVVLVVAKLLAEGLHGEAPFVMAQKLSSDPGLLLAGNVGGMGFTFLGAYVTARLSKPNCVLNTFLLGLISSLLTLLFADIFQTWYDLASFLMIVPVSLIPGYWLARKPW